MDISTYLGNKIIDHLLRNQAFTPAAIVYVSLHTGDPGLVGSNEVAGGSYVRQAVTLTAGSSKATASSAALNFTGMPAAVVTHVGIWDASTAGNFYMGGPVGTIDYYATVDATTDVFTSFGHGFVADDRVQFAKGPQTDSLPSGITAGVVYFVLAASLATDSFKISTTSGGGAVNLTTSGEVVVRNVTPKTVGAGDTYQIGSGQFTAEF